MEFIAGVGAWFAVWMFTWPFLLLVFTLAILCDYGDEPGWTIMSLFMTGFVCFHMFGLSWGQFFIAIALYVPIGIVWSIFRWKRHCNNIVKSVQDGTFKSPYPASRELNPRYKTDELVFWIAVWPASVLSEICGDFFDFIHLLVQKYLRGAYTKISSDALQKLENIEKAAQPDDIYAFIAALGGSTNITTIDACITRLRVTLQHVGLVDDEWIKDNTPAAGVVVLGEHNVQIIMGPIAETYAAKLKAAL